MFKQIVLVCIVTMSLTSLIGSDSTDYVQWRTEVKKLSGKGRYEIRAIGIIQDRDAFIYCQDQPGGRSTNNAITSVNVYCNNLRVDPQYPIKFMEHGGRIIWHKSDNPEVSEFRRYEYVKYSTKVKLDSLKLTPLDVVINYQCGTREATTEVQRITLTVYVGSALTKRESRAVDQRNRKQERIRVYQYKIRQKLRKKYPWLGL